MKKINSAGQMTLDFIFAFVLVMGLTGILFSLSLSLTVSSITQYITYASARNYFASHITTQIQYTKATEKFTELRNTPAFSTLFNGDWFEVSPVVPPQNNQMIIQRYPEYNTSGEVVNKFMGVGADLTARMLDFRIPFFGSTNPESQSKGDGFNAFLASYMPVEVSQTLCRKFLENKWKAIRKLNTGGNASYETNTSDAEKTYFPLFDNGC